MLNNIKPFFTGNNSKTTMKGLDQYIKNISNNSRSYLERNFLSDTVNESSVIRFIRRLISPFTISESTILKASDDFNLLSYTKLALIEHSSSLDWVSNREINIQNIMSQPNKRNDLLEYFLLVQNDIPFKYLPLDKRIDELRNTYPIRLIHTDSNEYSLYTINDQIIYKNFAPTISIFTIDILLLLFNWFKYIKYCLLKKEDYNLTYFIRNYVMYSLLYQQQDIVISNMISSLMLDIETSLMFDFKPSVYDIDMTHSTRFNFADNNIVNIIKDLVEITTKLMSGKITPIQVLNSIRLPTQITLKENLLTINDLIPYKNDPQLEWIVFLKDFNYAKFVYNLYITYPNDQNKTAIKRSLYSIFNKYQMTKFWEQIRNKKLKDYIQNKLLVEMEELF